MSLNELLIEPVFMVGFDLCSTYVWRGVVCDVRLGMHLSVTSAHRHQQVIDQVGTVLVRDWGRGGIHEFPPDKIVAHFAKLYPGMVGARLTKSWKVEYNGPKPVVDLVWGGRSWVLRSWHEKTAHLHTPQKEPQ